MNSLSEGIESSGNLNIPKEENAVHFSKKERIIKLVHAVALTIFSFGIALFFASVRQMFKDAWHGKTVIKAESASDSIPSPTPAEIIEKPKPTKDTISLTFDQIEEQTTTLEFFYTSKPNHNFSNILCPSDTVLKVGDDELHGNWVAMPDGKRYIATQAPNYSTKDLFWKAAFENQAFVVDITTPKDRINPYYPSENDKMDWLEGARVELKATEQLGDQFTLYTYEVISGDINDKREVQRLHFSGWKDFDGTSIATLEKLVDIITEKMGEGKVPMIHCRAGVGRTGTLISVIALKNLMKEGKLNAENADQVIEDVIMTGRRCRGPGFVQSQEQFNVIKEAVTV